MDELFTSQSLQMDNKTLVELTYNMQNDLVYQIFESHTDKQPSLHKIFDKKQQSLAHICALTNNFELFQFYKKQLKNQIFQKHQTEENVHQVIEYKLYKWVNLKNKEGFIALHFSSYKGNLKFIQELLRLGSDMEAVTDQNLSMLHVSAQGDQPLSVYFYLLQKMPIDLLDKKGSTCLHWACYLGCENSVGYILANNTKILDQQDLDGGYTPLHLAVLSGNIRIVRKLLIKGADKTIKDSAGITPVELAIKQKNQKILELLQQKEDIYVKCNIKPKIGKQTRSIKTQLLFVFLFVYMFVEFLTIQYQYIKYDAVIAFMTISMIITVILYVFSCIIDPGRLNQKQKLKLSFLKLLQKYDNTSLCAECEIVKVARSRHCEICKSCISVYDHHCPWINNCVGSRNFRYFYFFICTLMVTLVSKFILQIIVLFFKDRYNHDNDIQIMTLLAHMMKSKVESNTMFYVKIVFSSISIIIELSFMVPIAVLLYVQTLNLLQNKTTSERYSKQTSNPIRTHKVQQSLISKEVSTQRTSSVDSSSVESDTKEKEQLLMVTQSNQKIQRKNSKVRNSIKMLFSNSHNDEYFRGKYQ